MKRSPYVVAIAAVLVLAGLASAGGLAYLFLRGAPPAAVSLDPGSSQPAASLDPLPSGAASSIAPGGLEGTWSIDPSIGSFDDFSSSWVGYRVDETLAGNRANTANLQSLKSDDDRRDGQLQRQAIQTSQFPEATFNLTSPIELGTLPADGQTITATATGELTLHGVTRTVEVSIEARVSGDVVTVAGSIAIQFADYDIERPTSFVVLSIEDHGIVEFQLHFRHQ